MDERLRTGDISFGIAFAIATVAFVLVVLPFLGPLVLAALVVVVAQPLFQLLLRLLGGRRRGASFLASAAVLILVLAPIAAIAYLLTKQALALITNWIGLLGEGGLGSLLGREGAEAPGWLQRLDAVGLTGALRQNLEQLATAVSSNLGAAVGAATRWGIGAFIMVIGIYFFFRDGPELLQELRVLSPLETAHTQEIFDGIGALLRSLFLVSLLTAVVQGLLGAAAFAIVHLPHALLWAALMAFFSLLFSLVPILGTILVWGPVALWLAVQGRFVAALFIVGWGLIVLGSVDYVVRPLVTRAKAQLHPLVIFLSLFGGVLALGPVGAILGPAIAALVTVFGRVWRRDVRPKLS